MTTHKQHFRSMTCAAAIAVLVAVGITGCGQKKDLPPLHPVHGRVQLKNGNPATSGVVCFQSQATPAMITAVGTIEANGTFTLSSFIDNERLAGAVAGPHRVMINPSLKAEFLATELREPLTVKPGDNEFTLTVDGPG